MKENPRTKNMVWFNQAHLYHTASLNSEVRDSLLKIFQPEELPRHAYFGDGSPIEDAVIEDIMNIYDSHAQNINWEEGDLMALDNMEYAHGRRPFIGERRLVVAMVEPHFGGVSEL